MEVNRGVRIDMIKIREKYPREIHFTFQKTKNFWNRTCRSHDLIYFPKVPFHVIDGNPKSRNGGEPVVPRLPNQNR